MIYTSKRLFLVWKFYFNLVVIKCKLATEYNYKINLFLFIYQFIIIDYIKKNLLPHQWNIITIEKKKKNVVC